jgi:hypothetical protein
MNRAAFTRPTASASPATIETSGAPFTSDWICLRRRAPRYTPPFPATIHSFANNTDPLDYGPVIVLQHDIGDGLTFYTLYGHLSASSLDSLTIGQPIAQGQKFAEIGTYPTNGDWPPPPPPPNPGRSPPSPVHPVTPSPRHRSPRRRRPQPARHLAQPLPRPESAAGDS